MSKPASDSLYRLEKEGVSARIYLDSLTGLRGLAALWVAVWHVWGFAGRPAYEFDLWGMSLDLTPLVRTGWAGVDVFFVLSGFVLGLAYCQAWLGNRPPVATREYFRRRLLRVLPAYHVQIAVLLAILPVSGAAFPPLKDLLAQVFMVHNLLGDPSTQLNPVYWTLPVEFDFYLLLPLLAFLVAPRRWLWLLPLALLLVVLYRYSLFQYALDDLSVGQKVWWLNQLPGRLEQFVSGMAAAWVYSLVREKGFQSSRIYRWRGALLVAGLAGMLALAWFIHLTQPIGAVNVAGLTYWGGHWSLFVWHSLFGLCIAVIVLAAALGMGLTDFLLANRTVMYLGVISYSLYLWHFPLVKWLHEASLPALLSDAPLLNGLLWAAIPVLLVSSISYWAVERPFLRIRHSR
ncbi:MAG TPA: acyltransferase [Chromatiaceae bacterium]|nr:acyltransferase [Chromatiaceae bacterium]